MKINVVVVGKGGREHALVWKLGQSPQAGTVYCCPGNAGTAKDGVNLPFDGTDFERLARFCLKENVGLVVIGPEDLLALGLSDYLRERGITVFGPTKDAARIESSSRANRSPIVGSIHRDRTTGRLPNRDGPKTRRTLFAEIDHRRTCTIRAASAHDPAGRRAASARSCAAQ